MNTNTLIDQNGVITITGKVLSIKKTEILDFFSNKNVYELNDLVPLNLIEEILKGDEDDSVTFTKEELTFFQNKSLTSLRSLRVIELLREHILDMRRKDDRRELLRRYAIIMYSLKNGNNFSKIAIEDQIFSCIFAWVQRIDGRFHDLYLSFSGSDTGRLSSGNRIDKGEIRQGHYFISRNIIE